MIIDAILVIPSLLLTYIWGLLADAVPVPVSVYDSAAWLGSYLMRLDFLIPIKEIGIMLSWMLNILIAYFAVWTIGVILFVYRAIKIF